ncbi:hypothetical protein C8R44DRAFT_756948 [Mycena epipterygia]|nr:hypothetical protein C8R44DRAFT_756948 [Mycena epipterygia]
MRFIRTDHFRVASIGSSAELTTRKKIYTCQHPNTQDKVKKPRHRHSAVQLAALNDVYDQTEHPTLIQRTALAQSLGLEIKSVNAYFQNKRASSKKQPRGSPYDAQIRAPSHPPPRPTAIDDDYYYPPMDGTLVHNQHFRSQAPHLDQDPRPLNQYPVPTDHIHFLSESGDTRLSRFQIDDLQRIYRMNPYPTTEEARVIADRVGMRYQSITEWFRTQRSLDRRNRTDDYPPPSISPVSEAGHRDPRAYASFAPIPTLPPASSHPSLVGIESRRQLSAVSDDHPHHTSRTSVRRSPSPRNAAPSNSPYGVPTGSSTGSSTALSQSLSARQRRGRPDPTQLTSLRRLLGKTPTPSIEQRTALAREIGMDVGKVTNWFRNLRQSARKREREKRGRGGAGGGGGSADDDEEEFGFGYGDGDGDGYSGSEPVYLSETSRSSRMSSVDREDARYRGRRGHGHGHSSDDDEAQEAVTPSPSPSPSRGRSPDLVHLDEKALAQQFAGRVPYEDALLLLGFHRRAGMF